MTTPRTLTIEQHDGETVGVVRAPYCASDLPLLRSLPGARWRKDLTARTVSLAPTDRPRLLELAAKLDLQVDPELTAPVKDPSSDRAVARATSAGAYPFQVEGVRWLAPRKRALLGDEMGTGKTVQALLALPDNAPVVVVAPNCVKYNWRDEISRWRPDYTPVVLNGRKSWRFPEDGEVVILNYDILPSAKEVANAPKGLVVIGDEIHMTKNYKAARTKKFRALTGKADKVWALTGTPFLNRAFDLWGVLCSAGLERPVFGNWSGFLRLMRGTKNYWGGFEFGTPDPSVPEKLRAVMLRRKRSEVLPDLPTKQYSTVAVNGLSAQLRRKLDELNDAYSSYWTDESAAYESASSLPGFEEFSALRADLAASRIPAMLEMAAQYEEQDTPLIVFSAHRAPIDALNERDGWVTITGDTAASARAEIVRGFQAGQYKGIGLTIAAGGVGLTLTHSSNILMVDQDWTPALNLQAEDRACRIGATAQKIQVVRMVSDHPMDRHVLNLLAQKIAMIEAAIDATVEVDLDDRHAAEKAEAAREERREALRKAQAEYKQKAAQRRVDTAGWAFVKDREIEITEDLKVAVHSALGFLLSVCDGAYARDGEGFSKPDAGISRILASTLWERDEEYVVAVNLLRKYSRQLRNSYPILWA